MGLAMGIVGLPNVGKSTLLNALSHAHAEASNYPFCTIDRNVGVAPIDDPRLARLSEILKPAETILASIRFVDIAGLVRGASRGEGLGNQFLGHIRETDAVVHVVRCFEDETVVHVDATVDPVRDFEIVETEMLLADLQTVERQCAKTKSAAKGNPKEAEGRLAILDRVRARIEEGTQLRRAGLSDEERTIASELFLLSMKPVVVLANTADDDPAGRSHHVDRLRACLKGEPLLPLAIRLEEELMRLDLGDREEILSDLGLPARGLDRLVDLSRDLLGLITFYTTANERLQAWLVPGGTPAPAAAGKIHGDMEAGFIRVEVFRPEDLEEFPTRAELQRHGRIRTEGKEYIVQDGDICHFLFHS